MTVRRRLKKQMPGRNRAFGWAHGRHIEERLSGSAKGLASSTPIFATWSPVQDHHNTKRRSFMGDVRAVHRGKKLQADSSGWAGDKLRRIPVSRARCSTFTKKFAACYAARAAQTRDPAG